MMVVPWIAPLPTTSYQTLRGVSPLVPLEERERFRTAPFGASSLFDELSYSCLSYPDRTKQSVVHGCIEHRLGSTLECIDGVRYMDNNRENTSPLMGLTVLVASELHCCVLHRQAGLNKVNAAVYTSGNSFAFC